jgi:hypothetical protein
MLHHVGLVRTDVSEECSASIRRVARIGDTLMMEALRLFLQEPHDVTSQKMAFFIVATVKTANLT